MRQMRSLRIPERMAERLTGVRAWDREREQALVADVSHDDLAYGRVYGERTVWSRDAREPGQDPTHVTTNTTLPRRPRSRLRANASRAAASGKISTDGRRSSPASASLAIDQSWSRFGSTMKYSPPSGGSSATETSRPPGRSTAPDRRSRSPPTVSNTRSTGATASSKRVAASM